MAKLHMFSLELLGWSKYYVEIFLQLIKNRMYLALYGPTDLKSNADEAVMSSSSIWPCSMPRGP